VNILSQNCLATLITNLTVSNSHYKNWFFERQPTAAFQKTNFGYCSAYGAAIPKIGFKMRIAERYLDFRRQVQELRLNICSSLRLLWLIENKQNIA
jgi:hypothetical protein